jgi:hypothetical protein
MTNETTKEIEIENTRSEEHDSPLTVEVPTEIRAGVVSQPVHTGCSPYRSCYFIKCGC